MRRYLKSLLITLLVTFTVSAQSISVTRLIITPVTSFDLSYLDLAGGGGGPTLFTMTISPATPPETEQYFIRLTISIKSSELERVIYEAETGLFSIPQVFTITSNQFFNVDYNDSISIQRVNKILGDEEARNLILSSGALSSGSVVFQFDLIDRLHPDPPIASGNMNLEVANIRHVRLLSPGVDATLAGENIPVIYNEFPQFHWSSDLMAVNYSAETAKFEIAVYENKDNLYSLPDIINQRPIWEQKVYNENFVQYPASGAIPLERGRTYYWRVKAFLQGPTSGEIESELYAFKIADYQFSVPLTPEQKAMIANLEMILGSGYGYIVEDMDGLIPTGSVLIDGQEAGMDILREYVREFAEKKWRIRKAKIE